MTAAAAPSETAAAAGDQVAFGLRLTGGVTIEGASPAPEAPPNTRACRLELVDRRRLDGGLRGVPGERLREQRTPSGELFLTVDALQGAGYRVWAARHGRYLVSENGDHILLAPPITRPWRWQRLVVAQVLPLTALLNGMEILHASGVTTGEDAAVAFIGPSGVGKTSTALQMVRGGGVLLTDDVLALERSDDVVLVHPGAGPARVHHHELRAVPSAERAELGAVVARSEKSHLALTMDSRPRPLRLLYYLSRTVDPKFELREVVPVDPRRLLGSTFIAYLRTPARLLRQLDVCAAVARSARMFEVRIPPDVGSLETGAALREHSRDLLGAGW